ncbi:MAG: hypothetical protein AMXMBFR12_10320 [Candidatus Babeliales bacterium]
MICKIADCLCDSCTYDIRKIFILGSFWLLIFVYIGNMMEQSLYIDNLSTLLQALSTVQKKQPLLIGIDGRPGSGKTTVAIKLEEALHAQAIYLDEFFIPQEQWPKDAKPQFPFFYFRYQEFVEGVKALASGKPFSYFTYDWETNGLSKQVKVINPEGIIIVEGVSALNAELAPLYDKRIWVASDHTSEFAAIASRENEKNLDLWKNIYLPSVEIYCKQKPWQQADIIYAGRGIESQEQLEKALK